MKPASGTRINPESPRPAAICKSFLLLFFKKEVLAFLALVSPTLAQAAPCGTAILPNGIGIGGPAAPVSLNPLLITDGNSEQATILLYRPLVWIGQNIDFDADRSLAAKIRPMDDNRRFRVTLKSWLWSDGVPVTASDVLFTWERILKLGSRFGAAGQGGIPDRVKSVRRIDDQNVDFTLTGPVNPQWFILNTLSLIVPLPRHAWGDIGPDALWQRQNDTTLYQVVDGPFRLAEYRPDRYIAFVANPLYGGHKASLARLVIPFLEGASALHALQAGEIDMARIPYRLWNRLAGTPGLHGFVLPEPYGYWDLILNQRSQAAQFLTDPRVRVAMADAIDQQKIIRLVYQGFGSENHLPAPAEPAWRTNAPSPVAYNPSRAAETLQQAGWQTGPDGIRQKSGTHLAFTALTEADPDDPEMQMLQIVQADLRAVGVELHVRAVSTSRLSATIFGGGADWDAASQPITPPAMPEGSGYWNSGGAANFGGFAAPRLDRLVLDSIEKPGRQALFDFQAYVAALQPDIFLPQGKQLILVSDRLHGVEAFSNELGLWSPEYLSIDDGACAAPLH